MNYHIKNILEKVIGGTPHWHHRLMNQWKTIVGPLHKQVTIEKIAPPTITLAVSNSCLLQELYLLSPMLLKQINETLDAPHLKQIRLKLITNTQMVKPVREMSSGLVKKTIKAAPPLPKTYQQHLMTIHNPELREALIAFWVHCFQEK